MQATKLLLQERTPRGVVVARPDRPMDIMLNGPQAASPSCAAATYARPGLGYAWILDQADRFKLELTCELPPPDPKEASKTDAI